MRVALAVLCVAFLGCPPMEGSSCKSVCDCAGAPAPIKCPGDFSCTAGACRYACTATCGAAGAGCPDGGTCKDGLCRNPALICEG